MMYFESFSVSSHSVATVSEIYLLNISPLRLNPILIYDTAITEWRFDIIGCDDCVVSQQILKKLIPYGRHPGGDPRVEM